MTITVSTEEPKLVIVRVSGELLRAEVDQAKHQTHDYMQVQGKAHVMMCIEAGFSGLQAFVHWDDIEEDKFIKQHIIRMAIVGDLRWRDSALLFFFNTMVPFQIEYFPASQQEFARVWLTH